MNDDAMQEKSQALYMTLPQPDEIPEREREDAMGAYLMMFAALATSLPLPVINLIAAIIYYYVNRKKSRFIHFHALQSLISQIPTTLLNWGLVYWVIMMIFVDGWEFDEYAKLYLAITIIANLLYIIFSLIAAVKARKGKMYYFFLFGKWSYQHVFSKSNTLVYRGDRGPSLINQPPS